MELIYLYHSGFALTGSGFTLVFDYFEDSEGPDSGILHSELLQRDGRFYVLASHFHADHFSREVLKWREQRPDIVYPFSKDILRRRRAGKDEAIFLKKRRYVCRRVSRRARLRLYRCGCFVLGRSRGKKDFPCGRFE